MTASSDGPAAAAVAAAIARVLEVNPALLRPDTPLLDLGGDDLALVAIADLLIDDGHIDAAELGPRLGAVRTVGDLLTAVETSQSASEYSQESQ